MRGTKLLPMVGKCGHLRHYQTWFKWYSIFRSICKYIPSDQNSPVTRKPEFIYPLFRRAYCFREKTEESEDDSDLEWESDSDSDDCSKPESDYDGNAFDAFDDGL